MSTNLNYRRAVLLIHNTTYSGAFAIYNFRDMMLLINAL
jgi:hypothetical protein